MSFSSLFVPIHVSVQIVFWTVKKKSPMIDVSELLCMASLNDAEFLCVDQIRRLKKLALYDIMKTCVIFIQKEKLENTYM